MVKCLHSLRKYPLPLNTGKECIILEGFGDKICKLIDERLEAFLADGGQLHEEEEDLEVWCEEDDQPTQPVKASAPKAKKSKKSTVDSDVEEESDDGGSRKKFKEKNSEGADESSGLSSQASKASGKRKTSSKEYVPSFRSGPYALLITLLNNETAEQVSLDPNVGRLLKNPDL